MTDLELAQRVERSTRAAARVAAVLALLLIGACASAPPAAPPARAVAAPDGALPPTPAERSADGLGARIVEFAASVAGSRYRYGGAGVVGFDCSGLVFFAHSSAGLSIPRTVVEQSAAATPVPVELLAPGDLVFFRMGRSIDHVGIYTGDGRFLHASTRGGVVRYGSLAHPYFASHYVGAGRFWGPVPRAAR